MDKPEIITEGDPIIGRRVRALDGFEGVIVKIFRFSDGYELFNIRDGAIEKGGVTPEEITFLDEK